MPEAGGYKKQAIHQRHGNQALRAPQQHKRGEERHAPGASSRARACSREMSILWKAPPYAPLSRTAYTQPATSAVGYYCLRICVFTRAHARAAVWRNTERACRSHPLARFLRGRFHCVCAEAVVSRVSFVLTAREARQEHGTPPCDWYHALRDGKRGGKKSKFSFGAVRFRLQFLTKFDQAEQLLAHPNSPR